MDLRKIIDRIKNSEVLSVILLLVLLFIVWKVYDILFFIFGGILLAIAFSSLISLISRKAKLPWKPSFFVSLIVILVVLAGLSFFLSKSVISQFTKFIKEFPMSEQGIQTYLKNSLGFKFPQGAFNLFSSTVSATFTLNTVKIAFGIVSGFVVVLILILYLSYEPSEYLKIFSNETRKILTKVGIDLRLWLTGTFYSMITIGALTTIALLILGVPFAIVFGILAGILEFIPIVGSILAWMPSAIIAFSISPTLALYVTATYLGIHIIEGYFLVPIIQKGVVSLPPAYHIISIAIFGALFGFLGIFFAVPIVVAFRAAFRATRK